MKKVSIAILLLTLSVSLCAQQTVRKRSVSELVEMLVASNYSLMMSKNDVQIAKNNVTASPFMPSLAATARQNQAFGNQTGETMSIGGQLSWRMFDGGAMFYQYSQFKESLVSADLQFYNNIENLTGDLVSQYNYIISLKSRVELCEKTVKLSRERYAEALQKYDIGSLSGLDMKLAKTDLNSDSSSLVTARQNLDLAYITLSNMVNIDLKEKDYIQDSIIIDSIPPYDELLQKITNKNTLILLSQCGIKLSELDLRIARAARYPTLDFGAAANLGLAKQLPASSWSGANGGSWGFTISSNIFNGMETTRKIKNAKITLQTAQINSQDVMSNVMAAFEEQYMRYKNNIQLIDFETENSDLMFYNLQLAIERYKVGELSGIDFRSIQLQYLLAKERQISALYQAKLSQIELMILSGALL